MKWVRSNIRMGSKLALFALALQLVLSFGHFHAVRAWSPPSATLLSADFSSGASADRSSDMSVRTPAYDLTERRSPTDNDRDRHANDVCAICAVMAMARSVLFSSPPILALPQATHFLYVATEAEFDRLHARRAVFQPRAPPVS